ncbi:MAG: nucleotidyl transferase AbiEii/AbiGii toxin family protein [Candidatus Paraimprobicoccus trichonymphae]|uniref:Nucleotidyl transferase AbiEii/AbiGii toxin family protein n=1 Tax=Candidatus Paraimprobicoccus trichonymphae TaxID=3033793 RepID=A0AA48I370_9FIRM|nr:MAG: nucleotidyl transferase AbiEii/AbiGii toxin family protein [Candidatus Paraimprobicoccus trichonymphae]
MSVNPASIKAKLKNLAIKENKQFDYLLTLYFIERLLYRVSISKYSKNFVLKGGLLLYTILDEKARATKDIDFLAKQINNELKELKSIFNEICDVESDDAIIFDKSTIISERIKEDADYEGVRIKVLAYLEKTRKMFLFDIGFGDVVIPKPVEMEYPSLLNKENSRIFAYSLESVISEKFEAMIYLAELNSRMKDFYDIYSLCKNFDFDGKILQKAITETFNRRKTILPENPTVFSNKFPDLKEKQLQWTAFKKRIKFASDAEFYDVLSKIRIFLFSIYNCILNQQNFNKSWNHTTQNWR